MTYQNGCVSGVKMRQIPEEISATCNLHYGLKRGRVLVEDLNRLVANRSHRSG